MRKIAGISLVLFAVLTLALGDVATRVGASSHREAPLIAQDPLADNTDVYAFVSPDRPDTVTIIANYIPLEEPASGPNFWSFGDDVLYEIKIQNDTGPIDDVVYQFRFSTTIRNRNTFLYNTGPITSLDDLDWNMPQVYSVSRRKNGRTEVLGRNIPTPPVNVGARSTPNYDQLASAAVRDLPGGTRVFAGQRDDPFFVDLGSIFDLAGLRPFNPAHVIPLDAANGVDNVSGYNTHTIALQVPIKELTADGKLPTKPTDANAVIGVYAAASRQTTSVLRSDGSKRSSGPFVQVSRLGNPLVNEVIIPLGQKDYWNSQHPRDDRQFEKYYRQPELAGLVNALYPSLPDTPTTDRGDLVAVLLTGVPLPNGGNLNNLQIRGGVSDLLRLNMAIPPSAEVGKGNRLGVLAQDLAGFPNGRRLEDDVVDIELRAVACGYGDLLAGLLGLCNLAPNNAIGDGVDANDRAFLPAFPYLSTPLSGYESMPAPLMERGR
jgi:hypothetical protein